MAENVDLNAVWFVVSPQNPFKKSKALLHEFDRLDMVEMAIEDNPKLKAIDVEFRMPKPSYTIDTLTVLQEKYPKHTFRLIIGEDNLDQFMRWKNADKILEYFGLYVYPRPDAIKSELLAHPRVMVVEAPLLDISATYIRNRIKEHKSVKYLVPESVEAYIAQKKFYL